MTVRDNLLDLLKQGLSAEELVNSMRSYDLLQLYLAKNLAAGVFPVYPGDSISDAVAAAGEAASAASPKVVQLGPGTHTITSALVVPDYVSLVGCGMQNTIIKKIPIDSDDLLNSLAVYLGTDSELHNLCVKHEREVKTLAAMDATTGLTAGTNVTLAADSVVYDTRVTGNTASVKCTLGAGFSGGRVCLIPFASGLGANTVRFKLRLRSDAASADGTNIQAVLATQADGGGTTATVNTYPMSADRWYEVNIAKTAAVTYLSIAIHAAAAMAGHVIWIDLLEYAYSTNNPIVSGVGKSTTATGTQIINNCWLQADDDAMITGMEGESRSTIYLLNSILRGRYDVLRCGGAKYYLRNCDLRLLFDGIDTSAQHRVLTTGDSDVEADNSLFEIIIPIGSVNNGSIAGAQNASIWQDGHDLLLRHCTCRAVALDDASSCNIMALDITTEFGWTTLVSHCLLGAVTAGSGTGYHIGTTIGWTDGSIVIDSSSTEETYSQGALFNSLSSTGLLTVV